MDFRPRPLEYVRARPTAQAGLAYAALLATVGFMLWLVWK